MQLSGALLQAVPELQLLVHFNVTAAANVTPSSQTTATAVRTVVDDFRDISRHIKLTRPRLIQYSQ